MSFACALLGGLVGACWVFCGSPLGLVAPGFAAGASMRRADVTGVRGDGDGAVASEEAPVVAPVVEVAPTTRPQATVATVSDLAWQVVGP